MSTGGGAGGQNNQGNIYTSNHAAANGMKMGPGSSMKHQSNLNSMAAGGGGPGAGHQNASSLVALNL